MLAFLARRLAHAGLVLLVVSALAFLLSAVVGDPVASIIGLNATPADRLAVRERLGLDDPVAWRYLAYLAQALRGEFGLSYAYQRPVGALVLERLPATFELAFVALGLSLFLGVPLGVFCAIRRAHWASRIVLTLSVVGLSLPSFVVGILLIHGFAVGLGWLPSFGRGETVALGWWTTGVLTRSGVLALILPALSLSIGQVALIARLVRAEMLDVLRADYIRFARARGLRSRAIHFAHALRNTMIPLVTISGIQLGYLVAFAVVVESVFQWPGLGLLFLQALGAADMPVISGFLMLAALFFVGINIVVDLLYATIDPRLRTTSAGGGR